MVNSNEPPEKVDPEPLPSTAPQYTAEALKEFFSTDQGKELQKSLIDESLKSTLDQNRRLIERGDLTKVHPQLRGLIEVSERKAASEKVQVEAAAREQAWLQQSQSWSPQQWEQWGKWVAGQRQTQTHLAPIVEKQTEERLATIFDSVAGTLPDEQKDAMINSAIEMIQGGTSTHEAITTVLLGVADYMADKGATTKFEERWKTFQEKDLPALLDSRISALAAEKLGIKMNSGEQSPSGEPEGEISSNADKEAARTIFDNPDSSFESKTKAFKTLYGREFNPFGS